MKKNIQINKKKKIILIKILKGEKASLKKKENINKMK